jgi:crotonobetainyl-CoA:carnitine CoA-transferase CaiB-like acyl-CoA transferase
MRHPQVLARQMIVDLEDKKLPDVKLAGNPIKMDSVPDRRTRRGAPAIGEHNGELFGLSREELRRLSEDGVI